MNTTDDIKKLTNENVRIFISNLPGRKVRVSVVDNPNARNFHDGSLVYQKIIASWNRVSDDMLAEIENAISTMCAH